MSAPKSGADAQVVEENGQCSPLPQARPPAQAPSSGGGSRARLRGPALAGWLGRALPVGPARAAGRLERRSVHLQFAAAAVRADGAAMRSAPGRSGSGWWLPLSAGGPNAGPRPANRCAMRPSSRSPSFNKSEPSSSWSRDRRRHRARRPSRPPNRRSTKAPRDHHRSVVSPIRSARSAQVARAGRGVPVHLVLDVISNVAGPAAVLSVELFARGRCRPPSSDYAIQAGQAAFLRWRWWAPTMPMGRVVEAEFKQEGRPARVAASFAPRALFRPTAARWRDGRQADRPGGPPAADVDLSFPDAGEGVAAAAPGARRQRPPTSNAGPGSVGTGLWGRSAHFSADPALEGGVGSRPPDSGGFRFLCGALPRAATARIRCAPPRSPYDAGRPLVAALVKTQGPRKALHARGC